MKYKLLLFLFLIHSTTATWWPTEDITLFHLSYKDDSESTEDGILKIHVLYNSVYDEEVLKEEAKKIKKLAKKIPLIHQKIEKIQQNTLTTKHKEIETEELIKKTETNIQRKKAALRAIFNELST